MEKTILITGSTDGLGLETAKELNSLGHTVLLHGRNSDKLAKAKAVLGNERTQTYLADLSDLKQVSTLSEMIRAKHESLDVLINNAGVFKVSNPRTAQGLDSRFVVNAIAPYLLTRELLPLLHPKGRIINLSSAAQSRVDLEALLGEPRLEDGDAYAQSKLALTMWSRSLGIEFRGSDLVFVAVNPKSMLGTKMVKEAYGVAGTDVSAGVDVLVRAALENEFLWATGMYFDNDTGQFAQPHVDAVTPERVKELVAAIDKALETIHAP